MRTQTREELSCDEVYRTRRMKSLMWQIKEDHAEADQLWKRLRKGKAELLEIEELVKALGRLKQGLDAFKGLRRAGLEGVLWGEIENIEKNVIDKEDDLRQILFSIHKETERVKLVERE